MDGKVFYVEYSMTDIGVIGKQSLFFFRKVVCTLFRTGQTG